MDSGAVSPVSFQFLKGQNIDAQYVTEEIKQSASLNSWGACSYYGSASKVNACVTILGKIIDFMRPLPMDVDFQPTRYMVSAWPLLQEILGSRDYEQGLNVVALKLLEKLQSVQGGQKVVLGHLFDDLYEAFLTNGQNAPRALEMTWNTLGLLATRSADVDPFMNFIAPERYKLYFALTILSSVPLILDGESIGSGHLYSLPATLKTSCDYSKTYHFWMTAFFARKFGSADASYIAEIGYQMQARTAGRDPQRAFMVSSDDPANNKIRLDLAFAAAGAAYGSGNAAAKPIDVDALITALSSARGNPKPYPENKAYWLVRPFGARAFIRWNRIFEPFSAIIN